LLRKETHLTQIPHRAPGIIDQQKDKDLEDLYVKLQKLEEANKRVIKEMKRFTESLNNLTKAEQKLVNELTTSSVCQQNDVFRGVVEEYLSVTVQVI
jgi:hypothetical protein